MGPTFFKCFLFVYLFICSYIVLTEYWIAAAEVSGQEKDQAKQIFTSSAASGILTNDLVKILQDEKVSRKMLDTEEGCALMTISSVIS